MSVLFLQLHILIGAVPDQGKVLFRDRRDNFGRAADNDAAVRYGRPAGDNGSGTDDAVAADHSAIEDNRPHAYQCMIADFTAVDHCGVADRHTLSDLNRKARGAVDHRIVLNVAAFSDQDGRFVTANDGVEPDTAVTVLNQTLLSFAMVTSRSTTLPGAR